jgi:hypothetical protein
MIVWKLDRLGAQSPPPRQHDLCAHSDCTEANLLILAAIEFLYEASTLDFPEHQCATAPRGANPTPSSEFA